mmetsp:Transcript_4565/g.20738  ORF Transcript_4565/g.20738 Transcript_4565/m.20738 type:complete len:270 (+) Transcript_4565:92-901(+)
MTMTRRGAHIGTSRSENSAVDRRSSMSPWFTSSPKTPGASPHRRRSARVGPGTTRPWICHVDGTRVGTLGTLALPGGLGAKRGGVDAIRVASDRHPGPAMSAIWHTKSSRLTHVPASPFQIESYSHLTSCAPTTPSPSTSTIVNQNRCASLVVLSSVHRVNLTKSSSSSDPCLPRSPYGKNAWIRSTTAWEYDAKSSWRSSSSRPTYPSPSRSSRAWCILARYSRASAADFSAADSSSSFSAASASNFSARSAHAAHGTSVVVVVVVVS